MLGPTFELVRDARNGRPLRLLMNGVELDGVQGVTVEDGLEPPTHVTVQFVSQNVTQRSEDPAP